MSGLLEDILTKSSFNYISDLKGRIDDGAVKSALQKVKLEEYGFKEWAEAIHYLSGGRLSFSSIDEIKDYIRKA